MKARLTYEYNPENVFEKAAIDTMQNGQKYKRVLEEVNNYLRSKIKYGELSEEIENELQLVRDKLFEEMGELGITLD